VREILSASSKGDELIAHDLLSLSSRVGRPVQNKRSASTLISRTSGVQEICEPLIPSFTLHFPVKFFEPLFFLPSMLLVSQCPWKSTQVVGVGWGKSMPMEINRDGTGRMG
jgi:hypothetical protein